MTKHIIGAILDVIGLIIIYTAYKKISNTTQYKEYQERQRAKRNN